MIGFPLRLLARENYDRVVSLKGAAAVALITGEEKIVPARRAISSARSRRCPIDGERRFHRHRRDPARAPIPSAATSSPTGCCTPAAAHETMFIGAETIRPLLRALVPEAEIITRPRFPR